MSRFLDRDVVSQMLDGLWVQEQELRYEATTRRGGESSEDYEARQLIITVPLGFVHDFASIPRPLWPILSPVGRHAAAAALHDWLYWTQDVSRSEADFLFRQAMKDRGVLFVVRWAMWAGVRAGGWLAWRKNARDRAAGVIRILDVIPPPPDHVPPRGLDWLIVQLRKRWRAAFLGVLLIALLAACLGCATAPAPRLRVVIPAGHRVEAFKPRKAWRSTDVDVPVRGVLIGPDCPDRVRWFWGVDEPAEDMALEECERVVETTHPYRRGLPFVAAVVFYRGAVVIGSDFQEGRP